MAKKGNRPSTDLVGKKFAMLTVLARDGNTEHGSAQWRCQCECGGVKLVATRSLRNGNTRSCGCLRAIMWGKKREGWEKLAEYPAWKKMLREATASDGSFKVIRKWHMLPDFIADIGPMPGKEYTVGRYDATQDFRAGNVFWESAGQRASRGLACAVAAHAGNPLCHLKLR